MASSDQRTDSELLVAARVDAEAFAVFYRRRVRAVLAFFRRRVADPEAAADLMAETFAAALLSLDRYTPTEADGSAWLFAIARHKLSDALRRGQVQDDARRALALERLELDDEDLRRVDETLSTPAEGETAVEALADLRAEQRDAITARVIEERGYADIATDLRCSEAVVRQRVSRGLRELRTRVGERT
jgi:RNA polymerase sigma-70 factor (ECF subfamily)